MADSYRVINGIVVPYNGGRVNNDPNSWRQATDLEIEQQNEIKYLKKIISELEEEAEGLLEALEATRGC